VSSYFRNYYTIDMLLRIVEEFTEELKVLASSALNMLCRDKEVQALFKQFGACEKLIKYDSDTIIITLVNYFTLQVIQ